MPIPAFIVEGRAEQKIIQKICPGAKVMILECNGDYVALSAVAKKIATLTRLCGNRNHPIVVQLDREKRTQSAGSIVDEILTELSKLQLDTGQFRVGVSDRDMESWILYSVDEQGTVDRLCTYSTEDQHEGSGGEYSLRKRLEGVGRTYHKTTVGVELLSSISPHALAKKSSSFRAFVNQIDFACDWLAV